jgi:N-dimethylarginine dimethylaminohydrolase
VAPSGWDTYGRKVVEALVAEPLVLDADEALSFCANSVVVDSTVVMPLVPTRVGRQLEAWGFAVVEVRVDEFLKAGGGCRCLTLALDVTLSPAAVHPESRQ